MNTFDILDTYKRRLEKTDAVDIKSFDGHSFSYLDQAAILTHYLKLKGKKDFVKPYSVNSKVKFPHHST